MKKRSSLPLCAPQDRRAFLQSLATLTATTAVGLGSASLRAANGGSQSGLRWTRHSQNPLFTQATFNGVPLLSRGQHGLLDCQVAPAEGSVFSLSPAAPRSSGAQISAELSHALQTLPSGEALVATLRVRNERTLPVALRICFLSSALPGPSLSLEKVHLPLSFNGFVNHGGLEGQGKDQLKEPWLGPKAVFAAHFREPSLSDKDWSTTHAPLLIPLIAIGEGTSAPQLAFFSSPERGWRFAREASRRGEMPWRIETHVRLEPGAAIEEKVFLFIYEGSPEVAWAAFHRLAHSDPWPRIEWLDHSKVHYFDFLSPAWADGGRRGGGYEQDATFFRAFQVGLGTQHGYYPHWGDYIHPARKEWMAMRGDLNGPVPMSLDRMRQRIALTRREGARAAIYIHLVGFDPASPLDATLADAARRNEDGRNKPFPWDGPDMESNAARFMSIGAPAWRQHLLQQAEWIMELLQPDAIVVDETFAGVGYDHHPDRAGPTSAAAISFFRDLRRIVRSFGDDRAVLTSDCGLGSFVLWADGEGGDHVYGGLAANPAYRTEPVRYMSALHDKPWLPCGWNWQRFWPEQLDLARKTGAGLAVANGWLDFGGLGGLTAAARERYIADIKALA